MNEIDEQGSVMTVPLERDVKNLAQLISENYSIASLLIRFPD